MNVNGIGVVGYLAMYGMRETEGHVADKNFADEISKAAERLETEETDSGKAITKMRPMGDDVSETLELEDKYCSLCGSMIKEDWIYVNTLDKKSRLYQPSMYLKIALRASFKSW